MDSQILPPYAFAEGKDVSDSSKGWTLDAVFLANQIQGIVERELGNCERAIKQGNMKRALSDLEEVKKKLLTLSAHMRMTAK